MAEKGYVDTSVADVLRRARVSRETFYEQFGSKQDCFIAAFEQAAGGILASLERAAAAPGRRGALRRHAGRLSGRAGRGARLRAPVHGRGVRGGP